MKRTHKDRKYSVDQMMTNVASSLVRDFQTNLNDPLFCSDYCSALLNNNIQEVRRLTPEIDMDSDTYAFKARYQIHSILKRFRYRNDIYSDQELETLSINKFLTVQDQIRSHDLTSVDAITTEVINRARIYIANLLGVYSDEEHRNLCRFGRRASVGVPAREACEAARWELPISGSQKQISWFDSEMNQIDSVKNYWRRQTERDPNRSVYQETSYLTLTLVPKTFKSLRSIMPNTTIGSYMSYGIGEMIRIRLRAKGYNIKTLQQRHRVLASQASRGNHLVTADLSSASDTISVALVKTLFPPDWFDILDQSRIGRVLLPNGHIIESETFCTMGIGYTFPLQTLVFLALLKSIESVIYNGRWNRKTVSVYGDDMIYSSSLHSTVLPVFQQLGFVINVDKTFHDGPFRESCGGDYYRGVDVRPFQPRNGAASVGAKTYEAILYKFINGLLMRWSEHEVVRTLSYLASELEIVTGKCKLVPCDYPDDAGIKCPSLYCWSFLQQFRVAHPKHIGHGVYRFSYLRLVPKTKEEKRHEPYLWRRLKGYQDENHYSNDDRWYPGDPPLHPQIVDQAIGIREVVELLITKQDPQRTYVRNSSGRRLRRLMTCVSLSNTGHYTRRSGTSCFEDRR